MTHVKTLYIGRGSFTVSLECGHIQHVDGWHSIPRPGSSYDCPDCRCGAVHLGGAGTAAVLAVDAADREGGVVSKMLHVTMPDGSVWAVPAALVAEPRARYYAQADTGGSTSGPNFDAVYRHELATADDADLIDWAHNNMDWSDVAKSARKVSDPPNVTVDYQEGWTNGPMRVVDEP